MQIKFLRKKHLTTGWLTRIMEHVDLASRGISPIQVW